MPRLYIKEHVASGVKVKGPSDLIPYFQSLEKLDQESFWVVSLDAQHQVIKADMVSLGGPNYATVSPNIVFRRILQNGGTSAVLIHNHPSGQGKASREDEELTRRLREAGRMLEINILDHIVIAEENNVIVSV